LVCGGKPDWNCWSDLNNWEFEGVMKLVWIVDHRTGRSLQCSVWIYFFLWSSFLDYGLFSLNSAHWLVHLYDKWLQGTCGCQSDMHCGWNGRPDSCSTLHGIYSSWHLIYLTQSIGLYIWAAHRFAMLEIRLCLAKRWPMWGPFVKLGAINCVCFPDCSDF